MGGIAIVEIEVGRFITFEGGEGAGKSTQISRLAAHLDKLGKKVIQTREPGGSPGAESIRSLLVTGSTNRWDSVTEALLYSAARRAHIRDLIEPSLAEGCWVLSDRFIDSTIAYQGYGQGLALETIKTLQNYSVGNVLPNLTILLDIPVEEGLNRAEKRGQLMRYERMDKSLHERIRNGFLVIARLEMKRFVVIDAMKNVNDIEVEIRNCVNKYFELKND